MTLTPNSPRKPQLLEMLKDGLDTRQWAKRGWSVGSLKVRIHRLRAEGYEIESRENQDDDPRLGRSSCTYLLHGRTKP